MSQIIPMRFNADYKPNRDNLSPTIISLMDRAFYRNRAAGLNVQFHHDDGHLNEWSFNTPDDRDAFAANLARQGVAYALSSEA